MKKGGRFDHKPCTLRVARYTLARCTLHAARCTLHAARLQRATCQVQDL